MTELFIRLYLDEDVSVLLATLIRSRAFEAMTTQEAGRIGGTDASQLEFAAQTGKTLLTHNRSDFEMLAEANRMKGKLTAASSSRSAESHTIF